MLKRAIELGGELMVMKMTDDQDVLKWRHRHSFNHMRWTIDQVANDFSICPEGVESILHKGFVLVHVLGHLIENTQG